MAGSIFRGLPGHPTKVCPGHGDQPAHTLPATPEFFTANANRPLGLAVYCRLCAAAKQREWKHSHPEKVRAAKKAYRLKQKEEEL